MAVWPLAIREHQTGWLELKTGVKNKE